MMSHRLRAVVIGAVAVLVLTGCGGGGHPTGERPPNVLLVTLDTTRADRLGVYGYPRETSPNLDALAADGIRFDRAVTTAAVTPISHASILTGLNPYRHNVRVFYGPVGHYLTESHPTLATLLGAKGWKTAAFISAYPASERFGLHWGFETFASEIGDAVMNRDPSLRLPKDSTWSQKPVGRAQRRADHTTDQALGWLESNGEPFFVWVHYFDPHDASLVPPEEYTQRFGVEKDRPGERSDLYDAEIFFMDAQIGRLLDWLRKKGLYQNTIIAVVADHGQGLGDHGWQQHRLLYEEQIRAPLILRLPEQSESGVVGEVVRVVDLVPTILESAGIETPEDLDGESLLPLVRGAEVEPRIGYAEALNTLDEHAPAKLPEHQQDLLYAVVDQQWKLIYHQEVPTNSELYNLGDDPREQINVIDQHPEEAKRLLGWLSRSGAMELELVEPEGPIDPEALQKLEALGYLQTGN